MPSPELTSPRVHMRPGGAFLNRSAFARIVAPRGAWHGAYGLEAELERWRPSVKRDALAWSQVGGEPCVEGRALALVLGSRFVGAVRRELLQIIEVRTLQDLRRLPGNRDAKPPYGPLDHGYIEQRFGEAQRHLGDYAQAHGGDGRVDWDGMPEAVQTGAWAAVDGDPRRGPVESIEAALPFEAGVDDGRNLTLWLRSLKGAQDDESKRERN